MKQISVKWWLSFFGVIAVLAAICLVFTFIVPLESYDGSSCSHENSSSNVDPNSISGCLCPGMLLPITVGQTQPKQNYYVLDGEFQAYQDAKSQVNSCNGDQSIKLFL